MLHIVLTWRSQCSPPFLAHGNLNPPLVLTDNPWMLILTDKNRPICTEKKCFLWPQGIKSWTRSGVEYVKIVPYRLSVWQNLWFFSWKPSWCMQIEVPLKQFLNMSDSERLRLNIKHTNYKSIPVFVNFFSNIQSPFSPLFQSPRF